MFVLKYAEKIAELEKFIEARLNDMGFELVDLRLTGAGRLQTLELYCDRIGDESITVDDCARISERMKYALPAEGFFDGDFSLIVSSPGLDRVVKRAEDFEKFKGRKVKIYLMRREGGGAVTGDLAGYDDGRVVVVKDDGLEESYDRGKYYQVRLVPDLPGFTRPKHKAKKGSRK